MTLFDSPGGAPKEASPRYRTLIDRLYAIAKTGMTLGLEPITAVLAKLGDPQKAYPAIHVAGSNGKGSTAAFLAAMLAEHGFEVGLYTSPHLSSLTERVQYVRRGVWTEISQDAFVAAMDEVEKVAPNFEGLSFFEALTAAGLVAFRAENIDVAVVESGLGARLDATRLVDARVSVLTDLALEHTEILGDTLEKIAREKIAVARPGRPLVAANAPKEAQRVIDEEARAIHAGTFVIGREIDVRSNGDGTFDFDLGDRELPRAQLALLGVHQGRNALLAAKAATLFAPAISEASLYAGLANARWPGRLEIVRGDPPVLLDGAHNAQGAEILASALSARRELFRDPYGPMPGLLSGPRKVPFHLVFGVLADKDARAMLGALGPLAASLILTRPSTPRARDPREVLALCDAAIAAKACVIEAPGDAMREATVRARSDGGWVVVCGSLYLIGDVRAALPTE